MSKTKRPSIKGRGADIFLADDTQETSAQHTSIPVSQHTGATSAKPPVKSTFYLEDRVFAGLDDLWLKLRRQNKDATKSGIVNEILAKGIADKLKELEGKNQAY